MKTKIIIIILVLLLGVIILVGNSESSKQVVLLETNKGNIKIEMADDMPITTGNFVGLVEAGTYDGVIFHRIIDGFMIQGGDPTGTGMGDPSIPDIKDEFGALKNDRGTISMANAGPNTGSSQFFINLVNNNFLDGKHPVFGTVVEGMDIVDAIAKVETGASDRPVEEVKIVNAEVL
jgi:peptidylprolyl isomerase